MAKDEAEDSVRAAARGLTTLDGRDPLAVRLQALRALQRVLEADAAGFYSVAEAGGALRLANACSVGSDAFLRASALIRQHEDALAMPPSVRDFRRPRRRETQSFLEDTALAPREVLEQTPLFRQCLAPAGITHQIRLLAYDDERFVGWIGLVRGAGAPAFTAADRQTLEPLVAPVARALAVADRMERGAAPEEAGEVLLRPDGAVDSASRRGQAWLDEPGLAERLAHVVRALDARPDAPTSVLVGPAEIQVVRLDGADAMRYLAQIRPSGPLTVAPDRRLTARQREVARYAAVGATNREIAEALGLGIETVRTYVREIYRRLDIGNRVELARVMKGVPEGETDD